VSILQTKRCDLIPAPPEFLELLVANEYRRAGDVIGVIVPVGWPHDADARTGLSIHLRAVQENPTELLWRIRLIVQRPTRILIGSINLKGPPSEDGTVEIGWGVNAEFRCQGIATEASQAVMAWAFEQAGVGRVMATIPADNAASVEVAKRLGMRPTKEIWRGLPVWALSKAERK